MSPAPKPQAGDLATTVHEVLTAMFAPELRRRLLDEALTLEGCAHIPRDPVRARAFVEGPLRLVIKRRVGDVMASFLLETLGPVFEPATRQETVRPLASDLPVFGEDDDEEETWGAERDTDVYDGESLRRLRHRLRHERPQSGARLRPPELRRDDE